VPEFETTAQGCRVATSVGRVLTGRGAEIIIIDDPLKPEEALSQTQRRAANEWYDHTLYSVIRRACGGSARCMISTIAPVSLSFSRSGRRKFDRVVQS
jgi:hypothetical protein